jgi:hypothetical protein
MCLFSFSLPTLLLMKNDNLMTELMFDTIAMALSQLLQTRSRPILVMDHNSLLPNRTCAKGTPLGGHKDRLNRDIVPTHRKEHFRFFNELPHSPPTVFIGDNFNPFS